jgi:hypothetical protein
LVVVEAELDETISTVAATAKIFAIRNRKPLKRIDVSLPWRVITLGFP